MDGVDLLGPGEDAGGGAQLPAAEPGQGPGLPEQGLAALQADLHLSGLGHVLTLEPGRPLRIALKAEEAQLILDEHPALSLIHLGVSVEQGAEGRAICLVYPGEEVRAGGLYHPWSVFEEVIDLCGPDQRLRLLRLPGDQPHAPHSAGHGEIGLNLCQAAALLNVKEAHHHHRLGRPDVIYVAGAHLYPERSAGGGHQLQGDPLDSVSGAQRQARRQLSDGDGIAVGGEDVVMEIGERAVEELRGGEPEQLHGGGVGVHHRGVAGPVDDDAVAEVIEGEGRIKAVEICEGALTNGL